MNFPLKSIFVLAVLLTAANANAQQSNNLETAKAKFLPQELSVPDTVASKVIAVMDQYKSDVKKAIANMYLTEEIRKVKIDSLIDDKNSKLKKLLTEQQLEKVVPTTERRKGTQQATKAGRI